jgi:hypothetical protein
VETARIFIGGGFELKCTHVIQWLLGPNGKHKSPFERWAAGHVSNSNTVISFSYLLLFSAAAYILPANGAGDAAIQL